MRGPLMMSLFGYVYACNCCFLHFLSLSFVVLCCDLLKQITNIVLWVKSCIFVFIHERETLHLVLYVCVHCHCSKC